MTKLESSQAIMKKYHGGCKNNKLMELMKDEVFRTEILDICEEFDKGYYSTTMTRDLFVATLEDEYTFGEFLIEYDFEMEVLGEEYLESTGAI